MRIALTLALLALPLEEAEPLRVPDLVCEGKTWCAIRYETLAALLDGAAQMGARQAQLEQLCGWRK